MRGKIGVRLHRMPEGVWATPRLRKGGSTVGFFSFLKKNFSPLRGRRREREIETSVMRKNH